MIREGKFGKSIWRFAMVAVALSAGLCVGDASATALAAADADKELADVMPYVQSYLSDDDSLLITQHKGLGLTCVDCHTTTAANGEVCITADAGTRAACLGCHADWDEIVEATSDMVGTVNVYNKDGFYNPHDNHRGDANCGDCHKMHEKSQLLCVQCHNMEVPQGWIGFE